MLAGERGSQGTCHEFWGAAEGSRPQRLSRKNLPPAASPPDLCQQNSILGQNTPSSRSPAPSLQPALGKPYKIEGIEEKWVFLQWFKSGLADWQKLQVLMQYLPVLSTFLLRSLLSSQTLIPTSISNASANPRTKTDEKSTFPPCARLKKSIILRAKGLPGGFQQPWPGGREKGF